MKNIPCFILICMMIMMASCKEIAYHEPQPKGIESLTEIPRKIQGRYIAIDETNGDKDTLVVHSKGYKMSNTKKDEADLSDSLVFKSYHGYYFVNVRENQQWLLRVLQREKNGDLTILGMENDEKKFNTFVRNLNDKIDIDSVDTENGKIYYIDPSPKELLDLIKSGYFQKISVLKKIK